METVITESKLKTYLIICFYRTAGGLQVQGEEEISTELIEERERAIRQLEVTFME